MSKTDQANDDGRTVCRVCNEEIVVGERRTPVGASASHADCEKQVRVTESGQRIHTDLFDEPWLTSPVDAEVGMKIIAIGGFGGPITDTRLHDEKYIEWRTAIGEYAVATASEIKEDASRVIV